MGRMTTDLWCLVAIALWTIPLGYVPLFGRLAAAGMRYGFSNRAETPAVAAWVLRGDRALRNHLENLPVFATLVLVGHLTGRHGPATATAAMVFVAARIAHSLSYVAGIVVLRTLVFWVSLAAEAVILFRLF
jgi:uncharacterized MAPEG superfamily protein